jgi:hypothetical protein
MYDSAVIKLEQNISEKQNGWGAETGKTRWAFW